MKETLPPTFLDPKRKFLPIILRNLTRSCYPKFEDHLQDYLNLVRSCMILEFLFGLIRSCKETRSC